MRVAFVHYHLKRGGVTSVLENALASLSDAETTTNFDAIVLCGDQPPEGCELPYKVVEGLGYASEAEKTAPTILADRMQSAAKAFFGEEPDIWHIHNHSLGKNPSMVDAVVELANRGCKIILQIHDFAEDGRPKNYRLRQNSLEAPSCFPVADTIQYAVLNRRDFKVLEQAGIPQDKISWLPNPIKIRELDYDSEDGYKDSLDELILYPVRAVRRKNLGELLLHAALPSKKRVFVTTLGTTSEDFVEAYQQWRNFANEMNLNVNFEVCQSYGLSFDAMIEHSHCIISTSVAEGYGLGFLEPWVFGKTLVGRDLPEITADFKELGVTFDRVYDSLPIPITSFRFDEFRVRLQTLIESYHLQYGIPFETSWMDSWVTTSVINQQIDFAKLDEIAQREVIETVGTDFGMQSHLNSIISYKAEHPGGVESNASIIEQKLSLENYGRSLVELYEKLMDLDPTSLRFADGESVLNSFFSAKRFLPLRT